MVAAGFGLAGTTALAQTATNAPAATGNTSVARNLINPEDLHAGYTGIFFGPALSDELAGRTKDEDALWVSHRPRISYNLDANHDIGVQVRMKTYFNADGVDGMMDNSRIYGNIRNVFNDGVNSLSFTPRIFMPTGLSSHDRGMLPSPELITTFAVNPRDSRFSFSVAPQMIKWFYSDTKNAQANNASDFYFLLNLDAAYTLSPTTSITLGFYPEYIVGTTRATFNSSNELDLGVNVALNKNWSINPLVAAELNGMGVNGSSISRNMNAMLVLNGAFM